jgi:hypothetical protein
MRFLLTALLFLAAFALHAQDSLAPSLPHKNVIADNRADDLLDKHIEYNGRANEHGYRVQIFFGADKDQAKAAKARFLGRYSKTAAYEVYEVPNFKVRVGDFRTRLEAYKFLKEIQGDFSGAFIVESEIEMPAIDPK